MPTYANGVERDIMLGLGKYSPLADDATWLPACTGLANNLLGVRVQGLIAYYLRVHFFHIIV